MRVLVTGCSGFIGSHVVDALLKRGDVVVGVDVDRKQAMTLFGDNKNFSMPETDFDNNVVTTAVLSKYKFDAVCHLAAHAGVRRSVLEPCTYVRNNIEGQVHLLDECQKNGIFRFVYASSSSVYGNNKSRRARKESDVTASSPESPYAMSKLCCEHFADLFGRLYSIKCIGMRFFTVYGPRGRKDMATFKFLKAIDSGKPIQRFGDGTTSRDFTYIDDIVQGILKCIDATESQNSIHELYNLSSSRPVSLNEFIETCGQVCGAKVIIEEKSSQMGDVDHTYGNLDKAKINLNYKPTFSLLNGLEITLHWIRNNEIRH